MDLYNKKDRSIPQKSVLLILEIIILLLSYWILFMGGYERIFSSSSSDGNYTRHIIVFTFNLILFLRMIFTMFYLVKRLMPWEEVFSIPFAFGIYFIGFVMLAYKSTAPIDYLDYIAFALFFIGSYLNTGSELARHNWKKKEENAGKLYTKGLFSYSMHINYFGDLIWVIAYALLTHNWYSLIIVVFVFCFFAFYNIPKLDEYLASTYGQAFEDYSKRTKKFVPFIY